MDVGQPADASAPAPTLPPPPPAIEIDAGPHEAESEAGAPDPQVEAGPSLPAFPTCADVGEPGRINRAGAAVGVTIPYTDWAWPAPMDSVEFDLQIDAEPKSDGYLWSYQFGFVGGASGLIGFQANGLYQPVASDPGSLEITKFAFWWISGTPTAELGEDIPYPDSRQAIEYQMGSSWTSIHAKYDWQTCRPYRFRLAFDSTNPAGDRWYSAWFTDTTTDEQIHIGRMLVPAGAGQLSISSSMWTNRITGGLGSCAAIEPVTGVWGIPVGDDGTLEPLSHNNRFETVPKCGSSRFTDFPGAIRQELGLVP